MKKARLYENLIVLDPNDIQDYIIALMFIPI